MTFTLPAAWTPKGVDYIEPNAWRALRRNDGSTCVVASAGAGKTEFLAQKATFLLETGLCRDPGRILAISFKRDAAFNLGRRVRKRCEAELARRFDSMTFDAFTKNLLDRFNAALPEPHRPSSDYRIVFPSRDELNDFLERHGARDLDTRSLSRMVATTRLPIATAPLTGRWRHLLTAYWEEAYAGSETTLDFAMINRLVELLLRTNDHVRRALRRTYHFVFLDEFQDTTEAQYELLLTAFHGSDAKLTAVGDDKQRIMVWAGALSDGFERLQEDFGAEEIPLLCNWRSHSDLVIIQHAIACAINESSDEPEARASRSIEGNVAAIWSYDEKKAEHAGLSAWIAAEIADGRVAPDDIAILVRSYANDYEEELAPYLEAHGLRLRNVARSVGGVAIQDLLAEELTTAIIPLLRIAVQRRAPVAWQVVVAFQYLLRGIAESDEAADAEIRHDLERVTRTLRQIMAAAPPQDADLDILVRTALDFIDEGALRRLVPEYRRQADYDRMRTGVLALLKESMAGATDWTQVLDRFEGIGEIPLMTIHKSKGLEFHTMIFVGLDTRSWKSLRRNEDEELKAFFVAFTRAKQRAFFSSCAERGRSIGWIDDLLAPAGVSREVGPA